MKDEQTYLYIFRFAYTGGCVAAPISPEFAERWDDVEREEKDAERDNRKQPDEQFKRQIREETELDRALQRLVDDLELAVMGLSDREPSDKTGPGGEHLVKGEYLDLIIEKDNAKLANQTGFAQKALLR